VEPDAGGQHAVDERRRLIEAATGHAGEANGQAAHGLWTAHHDIGANKPSALVDPYRAVSVDCDIRDAWPTEQRLQRPAPEKLVVECPSQGRRAPETLGGDMHLCDLGQAGWLGSSAMPDVFPRG
jgi:hypothetical protein